MSHKIYDYIIIGSGFGGSVSAMRLSEKGHDVLVLEKGKRFNAIDFPSTNWNMKNFFWLPALRFFGFQKITFFKEAFILSGVGVGGGSLGYANTHMFPPDTFFNDKRWAHFRNWKETLLPFYERARFMLGTTPNKLFGFADNILKEVSKDMGRSEYYKGVDVGVYFGDTEKEKDPYFNGLGPKRKGCTECAGCMVGCRYGAKNTLDKNYLYFAEKNGAEIIPEKEVIKIEFIDNIYHIHTKSSTSFFKGQTQVFKSRGLVVSGGVLGTLDLLLKQKYKHKTLAGISDKLGDNLRTNSESLCGVTAKTEKLNHGIAITSVFNPDEHTHIEIVKYPDGSNSMKAFATLAAGPGHPAIRLTKLFLNILKNPLRYFKLMLDKDWAKKSVIFLVMQNLDNSMKMTYKKFPFFRMTIWNKKENRVPAYIDIGQQVMHLYAKKVDGLAQNAFSEIAFNMSSTAHIIGGCPMGRDIGEGVVNEKFEVFGYPNMYILDGSIIPCNLGVNPSLTITSLSEYAMSHIAEKPGNERVSLEKQIEKL
jgi:cholesterol oxidase